MSTLVDDVGSFPLPSGCRREEFNKAYIDARETFRSGLNPKDDEFLKKKFVEVVLESFKIKLQAGLDVANYPQQYDGMRQIGDVIHKAMDKGTFIVEEKDAFLPEVKVISEEAKVLSETFGKKILLRVSLFGPMELYLREIGTTFYADILEGFSETIRRFARNSLLNTKYIETKVVSIDEPSFGFQNINAARDKLCTALEKAYSFEGAIRQIHLHSSACLPDLLSLKNLDTVSFEFAGSPKNIESVSKKMLESADKQIRVGISRTDIDTITSELYDKGIQKPTAQQYVENIAEIRKRYVYAKQKFGDSMSFSGPDCGLGGWPTQESARLLLERTAKAIKHSDNQP